MGTGLPLILIIFSCASLTFLGTEAETIKSPHVLDLIIRDYTFNSLNRDFKTGVPQSVKLPSNLSGISVDTVRFRCGSLTRYGGELKEFHLGAGVTVHPCIERVMLIRQSMMMIGYNWSSLYYANYDLSGYKLVSPIVGLLAYNADEDDSKSNSNSSSSNGNNNNNTNNPFQLGIVSGEKPITIDFTNKENNVHGVINPICASFEGDGRLTLAKPPNPSSPFVCAAKRNGHFGLVISETEYSVSSSSSSSPPPPTENDDEAKKPIAQWKVAVGSTIGAALGAFLLGLLLVAMLVRVKKRSRMVEMERRAYEEEALQVSMVGHVRAPTASGTRTTPIIENDYSIPHPRPPPPPPPPR